MKQGSPFARMRSPCPQQRHGEMPQYGEYEKEALLRVSFSYTFTQCCTVAGIAQLYKRNNLKLANTLT
jgi:hypothetical protein